MKLLPEVPTQEIAVAVKKIEDAYGIPIPLTEVYSAIFTAAPDVKDEHCGWCHFVEYAEYVTALEICDSDALGAFKVYRHQSPRIAALEAEVVKLQAQLAKARSDAASPIYSADVLEKCAKPEGGFTDRDRKMHQHGFYCGVEEASESIRAAKDKP